MMHWGTRTALRSALARLGLSGRLKSAFVERGKKDCSASVAALMSARRSSAVGSAAAMVSPEGDELIGIRCDVLYNTLLHCISQSRPQAAGGVPPTMQSTAFDAR